MDLSSFSTYENEDIVYESIDDLTLYVSKDNVSGKVTHCFVEYEGIRYEVSETTYDALAEEKGIESEEELF